MEKKETVADKVKKGNINFNVKLPTEKKHTARKILLFPFRFALGFIGIDLEELIEKAKNGGISSGSGHSGYSAHHRKSCFRF